MSVERHHADWLSLTDVSGPFLSVRVLSQTFPNEVESHDPLVRSRLKSAFEQWELERDDPAIHGLWVRFVLEDTLELEGMLLEGQQIPSALEAVMTTHAETLRPDLVVARSQGGDTSPRLLVSVVAPQQKLEGPLKGKRWSASPATRMMELLHRTERSLGLVTNGSEWMLVWAKPGQTTGFASWQMDVLIDEPVLLRAFRTLLGQTRFFGVPDNETLAALYEKSSEDHKEVTDQLGRQVRAAVSKLISTLEWYDRDSGRQLLRGFDEKQLYEAALTVMMRLVFLLCAEERGLLLLGKEELYDQYYALSPLRDQLRTAADETGEEVLSYRYDAWSRLLALFRAVHSGLAHEDLKLPAYGGSLFDPDRFPFLEGRAAGTRWKEEPAHPLPVDNRTVLALLDSLQLLEIKSKGRDNKGVVESQRLSYRALDIEQIGHVYEGLLDHTAARATEPILGLVGAKKDSGSDVPLTAVEGWAAQGHEQLVTQLNSVTKLTPKAIEKGLSLYETIEPLPLLMACDGDENLAYRVRPYAGLVREGSRGVPAVLTTDGIYVTRGSDRRATGTHYTSRGLTEEIIMHALDPLVYGGMEEGRDPIPETLKSPEDILALKICDIAMGSGAFLVQACRYLSEKLVESWERRQRQYSVIVSLPYALPASEEDGTELMPEERDERLANARRLVAERCLYGVDKNPLAVEMAKLSLWLITLDAKKPFSFLDHALRCGDSLIGITAREQLQYFNLKPNQQSAPVFGDQLLETLEIAEKLRLELRSFPVREPRDGERKADLLHRAQKHTAVLRDIAGLLIDVYLNSGSKPSDDQLASVTSLVQRVLSNDWQRLSEKTQAWLDETRPLLSSSRHPFHWRLEFPEVFDKEPGGFDAVVGNPPYLRGKSITGNLGTDYREALVELLAGGLRGSADLCTYFLLRAATLLKSGGSMAFLTTNTISEGETREVGLEKLSSAGLAIYRAVPSMKWPGEASIEVALLWFHKGRWNHTFWLDKKKVESITPQLSPQCKTLGPPHQLRANQNKSFVGSYILGLGFTLSPEEAQDLVTRDPRNADVISPYINGKDLNGSPTQSPSRWVVNFRDWTSERAQTYPDCWKIIEARVKPERQRRKPNGDFVLRQPLPTRYWQYADKRPALYSTIDGLSRVLCFAQTSKTKYPEFLPSGLVYDQKIVVIASDSDDMFALLCSHIHHWWVVERGSTMRTDPVYTPSDCFETFPFPKTTTDLGEIGRTYREHRTRIMTIYGISLTEVYNRFHAPEERCLEIENLRILHTKMDNLVMGAYEWTDLVLNFNFHQTKHGLRYTIAEPARLELLDRLLALNHERHAQEVAGGIHSKGKKPAKAKTNKAEALAEHQELLF